MAVGILITGTPGTGKSTLSKHLHDALEKLEKKSEIILINDLIKEHKLYDEYDEHFDTYMIDDHKVRKFLTRYLEDRSSEKQSVEYFILETHTVTTIPKKAVDLVVVLTTRTDTLYDRLTARGYSTDKINENVECEIMRIVLEEAVVRFGKDTVVEQSNNCEEDLSDAVEMICELLDLD